MLQYKNLKWFLLIKICLLLSLGGTLRASEANITNEQVEKLVAQAAADIAKNAQDTFAKITDACPPYKNEINSALYVFIYDENVNIVAHPERKKVGECLKGKTDVTGRKFRDEIVSNALSHENAKGNGWVDYAYTMPGSSGIYKKKTYYQSVKGSDGKMYVVCSGNYSK